MYEIHSFLRVSSVSAFSLLRFFLIPITSIWSNCSSHIPSPNILASLWGVDSDYSTHFDLPVSICSITRHSRDRNEQIWRKSLTYFPSVSLGCIKAWKSTKILFIESFRYFHPKPTDLQQSFRPLLPERRSRSLFYFFIGFSLSGR